MESTQDEDKFLVLERVYLRLAQAADSARLTSFCEKHLPFLLEKLGASVDVQPPDVASRDKILEILTQLKKRLRSNPETELPVDFLLNEYRRDSSALIKNFSFLFLKIGFARLPLSTQVNYASRLFEAVASKSYDQQLGIWFQLLAVIRGYYGSGYKRRTDDDSKPSRSLLDLTSPVCSKEFVSKFLDFCADVLLLTESFSVSASGISRIPGHLFGGNGDDDEGSDDDGEEHDPQPVSSSLAAPNGLSPAFYKALLEEVKTPSLAFLTESGSEANKAGMSPLLETKLGIVRMLSSCRLASEEIAWLWALASADSHYSVVHDAEMQLKQAPGAGLNDASSMRKLYERYLGTSKTQTIPEAERRNAIGLKTKLKLMSYFLRHADTAAAILPQSVQVVFENWFGRGTNVRLGYSGTELAFHVVAKLKGKTAALFAPIIFDNVRKLLEATGDPKLGCSCYAVMGKLGKLFPNYVLIGNKRIEAIQELFDDLSQIDNDDICAAVQTCLLDWLEGFTPTDLGGADKNVNSTLLEACILAYAEHRSPKCRLTALRFLERLFSPNHAPSRFALFLASTDQDEKVRREADGILKKAETSASGPAGDGGSFEQACRYFYDKVSRLFERQEDTRSSFPASTLQQIISYLHDRLIKELQEKLEHTKMDVVDDGSISVNVTDEGDMTGLDEYFGDPTFTEQWRPYFELIVIYLDKFGANSESILGYLTEIIFLARQSTLLAELLPLLSPFTSKLHDTLQNSSSEALVIRLAEMLAYVYALTKSPAEIDQEIEIGLQHLKTDEFLSPSKVYLHTLLYEQVRGVMADLRSSWNSYSRTLCDRFRRAVSNWEVANLDVVLHGLKSLSLNGALRTVLPDDNSRSLISSAAVELIKSRKDIVTNRHKARCVDFIGCWMTGEPDLSQWRAVVEEIMKSAEGSPNIGLQPTIGSALVTYCVSPLGCSPYCSTRQRYTRSTAELRRHLLEQLASGGQSASEAGQRINWLLNRLLVGEEAERLSKNKNYKQASCIWVEVFLQACGQCNVVQEHFYRLQTFFISCLAEQNDFTQDVASRCLSLLFHCTSAPEQCSILARSLREQLTATTARETLLPYQEMCSLCTATCQRPELIYDMMLLALNRRSDGKKAEKHFSMIDYSAEKLKAFERLLVPAVFRLTYDPNPSVKRISQNLWASMNEYNRKATADDNEKGAGGVSMTEKYRTEIFDHLLYCLEASQWRYREAGCMALNDLLNSSHVGGLALEKIGDIWQRCLRVLDDVKESVALAAVKMINGLNKFTIRMCSPDGSPGVILPVVVPQLIESGLQSNAKLVRLTSLITLMALIKESPPSILKPHLSALMPSFLDALTWTEGENINYLSVRAGAEEREQIDQARIAASKSSPIMDSLETCCRHVDSTILQALVPKLIQTLQANVGLATKSGACRLLTMLRSQAPTDLAPFADLSLKCLCRCLTDRNTTFRKQAASTIGQLAPLCTESALAQFFNTIQQWYLDAENPSMELSCCYALRSVASYAPEVLKKFGAQIAPVAFLASHNDRAAGEQTPEQVLEVESLKSIWEEVLAELALSAHTFDIFDFCSQLLRETPSWRTKAASAKSIGALVGKMDADLPFERIRGIVSLLTKSLDGRTWDGKEFVFVSLGMACERYKIALVQGMQESEKVSLAETMLRECQKTKNPRYRARAIGETAVIADALELALWKRLHDCVAPCLELKTETNAEDEEAISECRRVSYAALIRCLNLEETQKYNVDVRNFGSLLLKRLPTSIWRDQVFIADAIQSAFVNKKMAHLVFDDVAVVDAVVTALGNIRQSAIKQSCITILRACCTKLAGNPAGLESWKNSPTAVETMKRFLESDVLKTLAKDLVDQMGEVWKM